MYDEHKPLSQWIQEGWRVCLTEKNCLAIKARGETTKYLNDRGFWIWKPTKLANVL